MLKEQLLMGNEAIGLGALHAGVGFVAGYPGTPSTEILETVAKHKGKGVYVEWSVNEKAALEAAAGAAYAGVRSMVTMKQVGLNVASDPLMSLTYVGIKSGMVVVVADDPGPISSQTEQDTRRFAEFAKLPVFDPSSPEDDGETNDGKKEEDTNPLEDGSEEVTALMNSYYKALGEKDITTLRTLVNNLTPSDESRITNAKDYIEGYQVSKVYMKKGMDDNSYVVYTKGSFIHRHRLFGVLML